MATTKNRDRLYRSLNELQQNTQIEMLVTLYMSSD